MCAQPLVKNFAPYLVTKGAAAAIDFYVDDADAVVERAIRHGAILLRPIKEEFYGSRTGMVADPFGYSWFIASKTEDVSPEEMQRRWSASTAV